jgi:hypothetical protein
MKGKSQKPASNTKSKLGDKKEIIKCVKQFKLKVYTEMWLKSAQYIHPTLILDTNHILHYLPLFTIIYPLWFPPNHLRGQTLRMGSILGPVNWSPPSWALHPRARRRSSLPVIAGAWCAGTPLSCRATLLCD